MARMIVLLDPTILFRNVSCSSLFARSISGYVTQPVGAGEAAVSLQRLVDADAVDEAVDDAVDDAVDAVAQLTLGARFDRPLKGFRRQGSIGRRSAVEESKTSRKGRRNEGWFMGRRSVRLRLIVTQRWSKEGKRP